MNAVSRVDGVSMVGELSMAVRCMWDLGGV